MIIDRPTVFALSTPVGGAITVLRISGSRALEAAGSIFKGSLEDRRVSFGRIVDGAGETVDTCCAVYFKAPSSYTGEDVAELSFHGSYAVARRVAELLEEGGAASPAEPGEFTKRAYLNGKMDLAQAEAVMDLISSSAEMSRRAAARQLEGRLSAVIASLYERVKAVSARLAAYMEDETGEIEWDEAEEAASIRAIRADAEKLAEGGLKSRILRTGARIAMIGSPNVGKSSLMNALILRERAIVTPIPGTTRDTVEESASVMGLPVVFVDTAGIRDTEDEIERLGIERSVGETEGADLVLLVIDGSREINAEDERVRRLAVEENRKKTIAVVTKCDLPTVVRPDGGGRVLGLDAVCVSALTGEGLNLLRERIASAVAPTESESTVTDPRHVSELSAAARALSRAEEALPGLPDAAFEELTEAMERLAAILGRDAGEELVDSIFAGFCIGK
jgi:tRNA modification GTPase